MKNKKIKKDSIITTNYLIECAKYINKLGKQNKKVILTFSRNDRK